MFDHSTALESGRAVALAQRLHVDLVVEGVETTEQLEDLRTLGPMCVEGYHLSRPLEIDDATTWLATGPHG